MRNAWLIASRTMPMDCGAIPAADCFRHLLMFRNVAEVSSAVVVTDLGHRPRP